MNDAVPLSATEPPTMAGRVLSAPLLTVLLRYALSALGPVSISIAHFTATLILLHTLFRTEFGLLSFALVVVGFGTSMSGALFGVSLVNTANGVEPMSEAQLSAYMKANVVFSTLAGIMVFVFLLVASAELSVAAVIGLYGGLMTMRWFGRSYSYANHRMPRAIASDVVYSVLLVVSLLTAAWTNQLSPLGAALIFATCALSSLAMFGGAFFLRHLRAVVSGSLRDFWPVWRDLARWSLLGVVTTEAAANAHAYLVTFISGPHAFALLAMGTLFMRPVSLVLTALPDAERPTMAQAMAQGKLARVFRALLEIRIAGLAVLAGAIALAAIVMTWFPGLVLKSGYDRNSVIEVICIYAAIMAVRTIRTPESVLLQVVGEFRSLAGTTARSCVVSIAVTATLLLLFGPVVSLLGILAGDLVGTQRTFKLAREWRARHG